MIVNYIFLFLISLINSIQCQTLSSLLNKNSSKALSTRLDCENFSNIPNETQILTFNSCNPLKILTKQNFLPSIKNLKLLSTLKFSSNLRLKKFSPSEILKTNENLSKKLKFPLLIVIESSTDNELLYEIIEGQLRAAVDASEFVMKFHNETMRDEAMSDAIKKNCALCLRIASIVDENYAKHVRVDGSDGKCDVDCIRALAGLKVDDKLEEISEEALKVFHDFFIENLREEENFTMPLESLASMAWRQKEFKIFNFLIRSDFPFPENFVNDREKKISSKNKFYAKVESYIEEVEKFHSNIKAGDVEEVKNVLKAHKFLRFARNLQNKSAFKAAIDADHLEVLSILIAHGMSVGSSEEAFEEQKTFTDLTEQSKTKLRQFNHDQLENIEDNYISKLMHRTSIFHNPKTQKIKKLIDVVREAYLEVNQSFPEVLEIASKSKSLEVIFNFQGVQVDDYDPTGEALGRTSRQHNYVMIGAIDLLNPQSDKRNFAIGTIGHEFMHLAMFMIYDNDANPYRADDVETFEKFVEVTKKCEEKKEEELSIANAFEYEDEAGDGKVYHIELIARVPDMVLSYQHNLSHVRRVKRIFHELFGFYEKNILPDIKRMIPKMEVKEAVKEFNDWFNLVPEIDGSELKICKEMNYYQDCDDSTLQTPMQKVLHSLNLDPLKEIHAITSNSVTSTLAKIRQEANSQEIPAIFTKLSFAFFENFVKVLYDIDNLRTEMILVVLCDDFSYLSSFNEMIGDSSIEHVIFVGDEDSNFEVEDVLTLNFSYKDLCEESQKYISSFPAFNFQGVEVYLENITKGLNEEIFDLIDVESFIKIVPEIGVNENVSENEEYLIKMKLIDSDGRKVNLDDFVMEILKKENLTLVDESLKFDGDDENFGNEIEDDSIAKMSLKIEKKENAQLLSENSDNKRTHQKAQISRKFPNNKEILEKNLITSKLSNSKQKAHFSTEHPDKRKTLQKAQISRKFSNYGKFHKISTESEKHLKKRRKHFNVKLRNFKPRSIKSSSNFVDYSIDYDYSPFPTTPLIVPKNSTFLHQSSPNFVKLPSEIFILSSPPFTGKSVAMKEIASQIKKFALSKWIIFIDLAEFPIKGSNLSDDEVVELLTLNEDETSSKFLLEFLKNPQKVVIMFDNFDKSENLQNSLNFIDRCRKFSLQLWISTRPHAENLLTKKLKNSKVLTISPLNHKSREGFLEYFSHLDEEEEKRLIEFVEEIEVEEIQLMHEIVENWSKNFYEMFEKILTARYENFKIESSNLRESLSFKLRLHEEHQKKALKLIDSRLIFKLPILSENFNIKSEETLKFGMIGKTFHKTFQQFYVAQFLAENSSKCEESKKLLSEIMKRENEEKFKMIVKFYEDFKKV